jgi:uncharacterized MAPEG superfamily protein
MSIAMWCVLIAGLLPYIAAAIAKSRSDFDNANPRDWVAQQEGYRKRANAAQSNGFETFPLFAVAVIIAMTVNHAPQHKIDLLACGFVVARLVYLGFYLANLATLRSIAWTIGTVCSVALFFVG